MEFGMRSCRKSLTAIESTGNSVVLRTWALQIGDMQSSGFSSGNQYRSRCLQVSNLGTADLRWTEFRIHRIRDQRTARDLHTIAWPCSCCLGSKTEWDWGIRRDWGLPKGRIQNRRLGNSEQDCRFRIDYKIVDRGVREVPAGARLRAAVRLFCVVCEVKPCKC